MINLTASQGDYLKTIYLLSLKGNITVTSIANELNYSKPSVVRALKNLNEEKLIVYNDKINLTDIGIRYAKNIIRRDNIFKRFLVDILAIDEKLATIDVNNLKHSLSCYTINKLENYIANIIGEEVDDTSDYCICQNICTSCTDLTSPK